MTATPIISAVAPVAMYGTTAVDQTLTCIIRDVTQDVEVSWIDIDGSYITSDFEEYVINQGTADSSNVQISTLTIAAARLSSLYTSSPLTWRCAAKSTLYPDSEKSSFSDLVVTFLSFG